jgi:hypothetical protein
MEPTTLFGVPLALDRADADAIRHQLRASFEAQHHRAPGDLDSDLSQMRALRPGARASTLRGLIGASDAVVLSRRLPEELLVPITATRALLTAEGRIVLDVLDALATDDPVVIGKPELAVAYRRAAEFYGDAHRGWMAQQLRGGDLRPHVFAVAVLLLINGSVGPDRALRAEDERDDAELSRRLAPVLNAFAVRIGGKEKLSDAEVEKGIRSAWPYTEAGRQLAGQVIRQDGGLWVDAGEEDALITRLGWLLASRRRPVLDTNAVYGALDAIVVAYQDARPALAARRLAFERSDRTQSVSSALSAAFREARSAP